ncbi:hypothetical protein [Paraburkholderia kururiensis]|jgi:uncharacterized membrane protein|uniref:Intracellular septation protein A n=1 Tax=Paraburkholderia kururiensis TaxID=984307 RepID=A0ABZ0WR91_9BURK|nr:hypothetical protein [Paraburkholderia kururiensis]WQD79765.1 hypothetical protein U0042_08840 [Paraburkholderia kururiensis]
MPSTPSCDAHAAGDRLTRDASHAEPAVDEAAPAWRGARRMVRLAANLAYPVVILCAWRWDSPRYVGCMLLALLWLQRVAGTGAFAASLRKLSLVDWAVAGALNCASVAIVVTNSELLLRLYPSLVNFGLLVAFGATLANGPSMIERFARFTYPDPPDYVVRYTRRVTQLWTVFFAANGVFSAYTALWWSRESWSLYNGAIAYGVVGVLLVAEIVWRKYIMLPRAQRTGAW